MLFRSSDPPHSSTGSPTLLRVSSDFTDRGERRLNSHSQGRPRTPSTFESDYLDKIGSEHWQLSLHDGTLIPHILKMINKPRPARSRDARQSPPHFPRPVPSSGSSGRRTFRLLLGSRCDQGTSLGISGAAGLQTRPCRTFTAKWNCWACWTSFLMTLHAVRPRAMSSTSS